MPPEFLSLAAERWDMTPEEHIARARELLDRPPMPGQDATLALTIQVIGARHVALALLDLIERGVHDA